MPPPAFLFLQHRLSGGIELAHKQQDLRYIVRLLHKHTYAHRFLMPSETENSFDKVSDGII
ncbi:hypothetical protein [Neisseria sp. 74A18]|uniref:hypothetical protein n=1 Tax=Neisseria sp. 74A18 TaxID=1696094 RepID=UPI0006CAEBA4|nr:hypothetical protein [Neisseria sp. 74A18]KPN73440.1 hypothetical protein AKG43_07975 [Neisseria sp. 74A18]